MRMGSPPPIVFITTDTQGRDMVSAYGPAHWHRPGAADGAEVQLPATPNIDRLAARGTLFDTCIAASPLCTPARSAWYTGLPPNRNGAVCNNIAPSRAVPMLGELLAQAGYATHHVGKWHLDAGGYDGAVRGGGGFADDTWYDLRRFYEEVGRDGANRFGGWLRGLQDERFCFAHRVVDRAIGLLQRRDSGTPLFLAVELDEPHGPYICPPAFQGRYDQDRLPRPASFPACPHDKPRLQRDYSAWLAAARAAPGEYPAYYHKYYDCNSYADHEIGRLLDAVERYCPEALLIYTSDHGDHLGAFGLCAKGPTMYDHTVAVPLVVAGPGLPAANRLECLTSSLDLFPTVLDAAGILGEAGGAGADGRRFPRSAGYSGRSLLPVLRGGRAAAEHRSAAFSEYHRFGVGQHQAGGCYPIRCVRTADWKLAVNLLDGDELYDLHNDPGETVNLIAAAEHAAVRNELHDLLLAHLGETGDLLAGPGWARRPWRGGAAERPFEGYFTTGYRDRWPSGSFFTW